MQSISSAGSREPVITSRNVVPLSLGVTGLLCVTALSFYAINKTGSTDALSGLAPIGFAFTGMLKS